MKYEYKITGNHYRNGDYYAGATPNLDFVIKTDDYIFFMTINDVSGLGPKFKDDDDFDRHTMRRNFTKKDELEFTGKWRITTNDSEKEDTLLHVEVKQEHTVNYKNKVIDKVKQTGWRRLLNKYKDVITWEDSHTKTIESVVWISEDSFEFRSLFQNECESCESPTEVEIALLIGDGQNNHWYKTKGKPRSSEDDFYSIPLQLIQHAYVVYNITTDAMIKDRYGMPEDLRREDIKHTIDSIPFNTVEEIAEAEDIQLPKYTSKR